MEMSRSGKSSGDAWTSGGSLAARPVAGGVAGVGRPSVVVVLGHMLAHRPGQGLASGLAVDVVPFPGGVR